MSFFVRCSTRREVLMNCLVGNAKLDGLTSSLHITGNQYLLTLTIYFIGYVSLHLHFRHGEKYTDVA